MAHKTTHTVGIPPLMVTPKEDIPKIASTLRATFRTTKTKDLEYRLVQLRKLYWGIKDYTEQLREALKHDLNKPAHDAHMSEIDWVLGECMLAINNLEKWAKDDTCPDVPLTFAMLRPRIRKEPYGAVLIIGTYNFPLNLNVSPLIGAIAAGCTVAVKPSESAPATAMVLKEIMDKYLDPSAYVCVIGAVPETTALLEEKWEKIFYTGGQKVAKIISKKAAETLTPVCLELGGKNPAFITREADLRLAARRLMWGKCMNAGQVCISHNYVLIEREMVVDFVRHLNAVYHDFFPNGPKVSPDWARIINEQQFDRIKNMLDTTQGKIVMGGELDRDDLYISPTAVLVGSAEDAMVQEESFGPIWAILPYDNLDRAIALVNKVDPTPLSLMTFGSKAENEKLLKNITSGGATLNDAFMHGAVNTLPFGGVGSSGTGSYRGKHSFECFSHHRTVAETPNWADKLLRVRYPPYSQPDLKRIQWMSSSAPNFDRDGRKISGLGYWLGLVFGLGSSSAKGACFRWLLLLVSSYAVRYGFRTRG